MIMRWFSKPKFHIVKRLKNTPLKLEEQGTINEKETFKRMLSFLFWDKGKLLVTQSSFRDFQWPVLKCNEGSNDDLSGTFCTLWTKRKIYGQREN